MFFRYDAIPTHRNYHFRYDAIPTHRNYSLQFGLYYIQCTYSETFMFNLLCKYIALAEQKYKDTFVFFSFYYSYSEYLLIHKIEAKLYTRYLIKKKFYKKIAIYLCCTVYK